MVLRSLWFSLCFVLNVEAHLSLRGYSESVVSQPKMTQITQNTSGGIPLFAYEENHLTTQELQKIEQQLQQHYDHDFVKHINGLFDFDLTDVTQTQAEVNYTFAGPGSCKLFPGDSAYPSLQEWAALNIATGGSLLNPAPQAHVCYPNGTGSVPDQSACNTTTANWTDPYFQLDDPIEMLTPIYQGMTCQPPSIFDSTLCTQGGYPLYVVRATNVRQIQLAVNFARNTGIRLVIRNTGHDFLGKSGGAGALSIWTHYLKNIGYIAEYCDSKYTGPAMKVGAGVHDFEIYAAASKLGLAVLGGECPTVGMAGGFIQGGGHSPLSPLHGMAADQALGFEVVTADGRFVTANRDENPDLFWALRGGGGGTYGVVTSVVVKAYTDMPITSASWTFQTGDNITKEAFSAATRAYFKHFPQGVDAQTYSYFKIFPYSFTMSPFFAPNKSLEDAQALLQPWLDEAKALGIDITPKWNHFDGFLQAYKYNFPAEAVINQGVVTASRMFPRANWANESIFNATYDALWSNVENRMPLIVYNIAPTWAAGGYQDNAVNPAWREAIGFIITGISQNWTQPANFRLAEHLNFTNGPMQVWRDLTPGSGSYLNEADRLEPNFQWAFWGSFYPRLLELKTRYDPFNLFWAATAVGSEFFEVRSIDGYPDENGRLCKKDNPSLYVAEGPDWVPH